MMQGDKFIIAALLSIILLIFFFIVYPTVAIFISMFYDGETFAPEQVVRILGQGYIVRVISNSLFLSGFVGIVSTVFGLAFALYTTRIAHRTAFIGKIFSNPTDCDTAVCGGSWRNFNAWSFGLRDRIFRYLFRL
ncbi:ABC-type thiamine transport system permease [Actinobacillus pleuropneumoniae]|nr:ABC-type thiamine transport system permease [Actinobacillus pleuropneumoniae]